MSLMRGLTRLQRGTLIALMLLWVGGGVFVASVLCSEHPEFLARAVATIGTTGLVIALAHFGILRLFRSQAACIGLILAKLCVLPLTGSFGMLALGLVAMSTDSGMDAGARMAYFTVPVGMVMTAVPTTIGAFAGAALGQFVGRVRQRRSAAGR